MADSPITGLTEDTSPTTDDLFLTSESPFGASSSRKVRGANLSKAVGYTNANPVPTTIGGITAGSTFNETSLKTVLDTLLYPYVAPSVTLSLNPAAGLREFGDTIATPILTPTTTKHSNPITTLTLSRSGVGVIHTYGSPNPNGATEAPYTDVSGTVSVNTTFTATVGDGTSTTTGTAAYNFVYPYYYGVGAPGLTGAQIAALTKLVAVQGNKVENFAPSAQVYYFAYPASYPDLTSIIDANGFNITADWTLRNPIAIVGLDGTSQNYKVYEFNNINSVTQNITFNY